MRRQMTFSQTGQMTCRSKSERVRGGGRGGRGREEEVSKMWEVVRGCERGCERVLWHGLRLEEALDQVEEVSRKCLGSV